MTAGDETAGGDALPARDVHESETIAGAGMRISSR